MSTLALRHELRCPAGKPNVTTTTLAYARREKNTKKNLVPRQQMKDPLARMLFEENGFNQGVTYLYWKWSSGWLDSWQGLLFATDVCGTCAEAIFTWLWRWLPHRLSKLPLPTTVLVKPPVNQMIIFNQSKHSYLSKTLICQFPS